MPSFNNGYSNYAPLPAYGSQQSMQAANNYQKYQPGLLAFKLPVAPLIGVNSCVYCVSAPAVRTSAFAPVAGAAVGVEPNRHFRSVSASDLYQSDVSVIERRS